MSFFTRELKTEPLVVKTVQELVGISSQGDNFKATYEESYVYPDGTKVLRVRFYVDRSIETVKDELAAWIDQGRVFAEQWREANEAQRVADAGKADEAQAADVANQAGR